MPTLLCTLGTSPAVILEAIFSRLEYYTTVRCITSEGNQKSVEHLFAQLRETGYDNIDLQVETVPGFSSLNTQDDHENFQEALYRFYIDHGLFGPNNEVHVCLAGGYKSMTAALQKATHLFGAGKVFHVFADPYIEIPETGNSRHPETIPEILEGLSNNKIRVIDMGPEPGRSFILNNLDALRKADSKTVFIDKLLSHSDAITKNIDRFHELPFSVLAGLDSSKLEWLETPLIDIDASGFIEQLPKIELHCHLGGFATHDELLKQVREAAENPGSLKTENEPALPEGWPLPQQSIPLEDYMKLGNANGSTLLQDPGCLAKQIELLYEELQNDRVLYAEIRCSPGNYAGMGRSALNVLEDIRSLFQEQMDRAHKNEEWVTHVNLIIIVTRKDKGDLSSISRHLALAVSAFQAGFEDKTCRVVGVDLAGFEYEKTRPEYFRTDFDLAHRTGVAVTAHAGEVDDVESIWQAVFRLNARRLGHALKLRDAEDLFRAVIDRGIGIEMCPYANYQIVGFEPMEGKPSYPLSDYLRAGAKVTVNTDNIGISDASLSDNLKLLPRLCPDFRVIDLLQLQRNALDVAFIPHDERNRLEKQMNKVLWEVIINE